jgi:hypothetical protein
VTTITIDQHIVIEHPDDPYSDLNGVCLDPECPCVGHTEDYDDEPVCPDCG